MKKLFRLLLRYAPWQVFLALVASVIAGLLGTFFIGLVNHILDQAEPAQFHLVAAFIGLLVLTPILRFSAEFLLMRLAQRATYDLRCKLSRVILGAPLRQLEKLGSNKLLATLTSDVATIGGLLPEVPIVFSASAVVVGTMGYLFWLHATAALGLVAVVIVAVVAYALIFRVGIRYFRLSRDRRDALVKNYEGLVFGAKELKLHRRRRDAFLQDGLDRHAADVRDYNVRGQGWFVVASVFGETMLVAVTGCVLFLLPMAWPATDDRVIRGFVLAVMYLIGPLQQLVALGSRLGQGAVALDKIEQLGLKLECMTVETAAPLAEAVGFQSLHFDQVARAYHVEREDRSFTLGPVDLRFQPGELVFIIGGNGSGKTTLAKLMMGLYEPEAGEVWWDGHPVDDAKRDAFRQLFTGVFSDFFLFESLLGLEAERLDAQARHYLRRLHLDHKVDVVDGVLSSVALSQGQRKRLALLTAYLEDRPIYLFDEWASDQDPDFKDVFYRAILPALKARGKLVLAITHDDRYFHLADRVIKLDYGQIVADEPVAAGTTPHANPLP